MQASEMFFFLKEEGGGGVWCLMPLSTIFQLYRGGNRSTQRKPPICHKSHKLYHIMLYRLSGIQTHNASGDRHRLLR
jgi:hypothetical protein